MSILTEKEREDVYKYWLHSSTLTNEDGLIQLAEKAVLEKLAGMELPEPKYIYHFDPSAADGEDEMYEFQYSGAVDAGCQHCTRLFTVDQLHQAYAQGAASQLSAEPVFFAYQYSDGTYHDGSATEHSSGMKSLYAPKQPK